MTEENSNPPGFFGPLRKAVLTGVAVFHNRADLVRVELQEEKAHLIEMLLWTAIAGVLALLFLMMLTATVIFLFPAGWRVGVAAVFCGIYLLATVLAVLNLRALWRSTPDPFSGTIGEVKKDVEWLESLK